MWPPLSAAELRAVRAPSAGEREKRQATGRWTTSSLTRRWTVTMRRSTTCSCSDSWWSRRRCSRSTTTTCQDRRQWVQRQKQRGPKSVAPPSVLSVNFPAPATPLTPRTPVGSTDPGIVPTLQNIVSTVNLGCKLDLKKIALHARNAEYNPKRFAAVIMRIREPRTTALIFSSGKMVCTGAKSEEMSRLAARKYARIVQKLGFEAKFLDFKIQNMVGSCDVKFPIRLEGLVLTHSQFSSYEPELFPGPHLSNG